MSLMMNTTKPITADTKFEIAGYKTEYVVVLMAPRYPARFDNKADAEAFAAKRGRSVRESLIPIYRRVQ